MTRKYKRLMFVGFLPLLVGAIWGFSMWGGILPYNNGILKFSAELILWGIWTVVSFKSADSDERPLVQALVLCVPGLLALLAMGAYHQLFLGGEFVEGMYYIPFIHIPSCIFWVMGETGISVSPEGAVCLACIGAWCVMFAVSCAGCYMKRCVCTRSTAAGSSSEKPDCSFSEQRASDIEKQVAARTIILPIICGVVTAVLIFYIIPRFFGCGVNDRVWGILMLLLPAITAVILLHIVGKCPPKSVFLGLLVECIVAYGFSDIIGELLGYKLRTAAWDDFHFIPYIGFVLELAVAATITQFVVLLVIRKFKRK